MASKTINICLVGGQGVGKTTFMLRHMTGQFLEVPSHNRNVDESYNLPFHFNKCGLITFKVTVCNTSEALEKCVIKTNPDVYAIMFDATHPHGIIRWYNRILKHCSDQEPIAILRTQIDRVSKPDALMFELRDLKRVCSVQDVSAKSMYNFERPFLDVARQLLDDNALEMIGYGF